MFVNDSKEVYLELDKHYVLQIYHKDDDLTTGMDISELSHSISHTTSLDGQAGKLTFEVEKDTNGILEISLGDLVSFTVGNEKVFLGYIFTLEADDTEVYRVTAYDTLRYFQYPEIWKIEVEDRRTLYSVFAYFCGVYNIKYKDATNPDKRLCVLSPYFFNNVTVYDILQHCMNETMFMEDKDVLTDLFYNVYGSTFGDNISSNKIYSSYFLRDEYGVLTLRDITYDALTKPLVIIGDESLLTSYDYSVSIDSDTYNEFTLVREEAVLGSDEQVEEQSDTGDDAEVDLTVPDLEDVSQTSVLRVIADIQAGTVIQNTGTELDGKTIGEDTIYKWGILKQIVDLKGITDTEDIYEYVKALIEIHNKPTRRLRLTALGYDGLYAGSPVWLQIKELGLNTLSYIESIEHHYDSKVHTMDLDVMVRDDIKNMKIITRVGSR